jgi:hypothetical protein
VAGLFTAGMLLGSAPATAQNVPGQEADPFASVLFPPELIMQHARAIRLTDDQRSSITRLIGQVQQRVIGLQWQLAEQVQALTQTLGGTRIDQDRAIDQRAGDGEDHQAGASRDAGPHQESASTRAADGARATARRSGG